MSRCWTIAGETKTGIGGTLEVSTLDDLLMWETALTMFCKSRCAFGKTCKIGETQREQNFIAAVHGEFCRF